MRNNPEMLDHKGNVTAQIEYTKHSSRWTMPAENHKQSLTDGTITVDIIMIDTSKPDK